jgi:quercetin dioxygenase-like cupin family protein
MHHHKIKEETFYVLSGKVFLETEFKEFKETRLMEPGDIAHIKPEMWHRVTALVDSEIIEFSTHHIDEDSYRRTKSCKVNLKELKLDLYL